MTDGVRAALEAHLTIQTDVVVKRWYRTLPDINNDNEDSDQALVQKYTNHVEQLECSKDVTKHTVDFLNVTRATRETDFRWLTKAVRLPKSDISKFILTRRAQFVIDYENDQDILDLVNLSDFHAESSEKTVKTVMAKNVVTTNMHAGHALSMKIVNTRQSAQPASGFLANFRKLLESNASQTPSIESFHSSTPRRKRRNEEVDQASDVFAVFEKSSVGSPDNGSSPASSLSPEEPAKHANPSRNGKKSRTAVGLKGRQPLQLAAVSAGTTTKAPLRVEVEVNKVGPAKKARARLQPVTRKVPSNGIPITAAGPALLMQAHNKVISNSRKLHALGGSWPLKRASGKSAPANELEVEQNCHTTVDASTEMIEDYTVIIEDDSTSTIAADRPEDEGITSFSRKQAQAQTPTSSPVRRSNRLHARSTSFSASPAQNNQPAPPTYASPPIGFNVSLQNASSPRDPLVDNFFDQGPVSSSVEASEALERPSYMYMDTPDPLRSTNLPNLPDQDLLPDLTIPADNIPSGSTHTASKIRTRALFAAASGSRSRTIPDISITLATGSVDVPLPNGHTTSPDAMSPVVSEADEDEDASREPVIALATFLSLAFDQHDVQKTRRYDQTTLPSRSIPKFRTLSRPIPATEIHLALVPVKNLHDSGQQGFEYLSPGRRGCWVLPLSGRSAEPLCSQGLVLGLSRNVTALENDFHPIVWTLARLQLLVTRVHDIAKLGKFGVVTIFPAVESSGSECVKIGCQASMALMLRTVLSELTCPLDSEGREVGMSDAVSSVRTSDCKTGEKWLSSQEGIRFVWWDERERKPILVA